MNYYVIPKKVCDLTAAKGASGAQWLVALLVGTAVVEDVQVLVDVGVLELCPAVVGDQGATLECNSIDTFGRP